MFSEAVVLGPVITFRLFCLQSFEYAGEQEKVNVDSCYLEAWRSDTVSGGIPELSRVNPSPLPGRTSCSASHPRVPALLHSGSSENLSSGHSTLVLFFSQTSLAAVAAPLLCLCCLCPRSVFANRHSARTLGVTFTWLSR